MVPASEFACLQMLTFRAIKIPESGIAPRIEKVLNQAEIKEVRGSKLLLSLACVCKGLTEIKQLRNCPVERRSHRCELVAVITGNYEHAE